MPPRRHEIPKLYHVGAALAMLGGALALHHTQEPAAEVKAAEFETYELHEYGAGQAAVGNTCVVEVSPGSFEPCPEPTTTTATTTTEPTTTVSQPPPQTTTTQQQTAPIPPPTTTTTATPPPPAQEAPHPQHSQQWAPPEGCMVPMGPTDAKTIEEAHYCWDGLIALYNWPHNESFAVMYCESKGNPHADNPESTASGLWQILGGSKDPKANADQAYAMYKERGWQPWDACDWHKYL